LTDQSVLDIVKPILSVSEADMARKADPTKKDRIIEAAAKVFAQKGYSGTLMAQVAQAAGIGKGTIYEYFRSKEALFFAVFEHLIVQSGAQMQAVMAADPPGSTAQRLQALADGLIRMWLPQLDLYSLVMEFWSATATLPGRRRFKEAFQTAYADFRKLVADLIHSGYDSGEFKASADPRQVASALIGSWDALLLQAWLDPDFDPLEASRQHMLLIIKGLSSPRPLEVP
jgi:AcrR family transcriptional regulator